MSNMRTIQFLYSILTLLWVMGCSESKNVRENTTSPRIKSFSSMSSPKNGSVYTIGDSIVFHVESEENVKIDSIVLRDDQNNVLVSQTNNLKIGTKNHKTGRRNFSLKVYLTDNKPEIKSTQLILLSDVSPDNYTYKINNTFPHDKNAYIQGLFIDQGIMYESTGQKGYSSVRIVDLATGNVIKKTDLASKYFGEGIATYQDKIYMLTWTSREGFVYDKKSLELVRQFSFPTEGWGMTIKEDSLIMSDGTSKLYFMEPDGFTEVKRLEVYDQNGAIDKLNELEYFNGKIYANRYYTDLIYEIDPSNGKVTGIINLEGIIEPDVHDNMDVLNGIAYDSDQEKIFVTGKNWPTLFEIEFVKTTNNL